MELEAVSLTGAIAEDREQLDAILGQLLGLVEASVEDSSLAMAIDPGGNLPVAAVVIRVSDVSGDQLLDAYEAMRGGTGFAATIGGKQVIVHPDPSVTDYIYAADDAVFIIRVSFTDPTLSGAELAADALSQVE